MRFADNCRGRRRVSYRKCWYEIPQGERWSAGVVGVSVRDSTSSTCGAWERRQQMNRFGAQAMKYWKTWLPSRYAGIEDPQMFFTNLGIQVQDEVAAGCLEWESRDRDQLNQLDYLARVGRRRNRWIRRRSGWTKRGCRSTRVTRCTGCSRTTASARSSSGGRCRSSGTRCGRRPVADCGTGGVAPDRW